MNNSSALSQQAISAALSSNWEKALELNQQIVDTDPKNVEALNRLGRASFELGKLTQAKKYFDCALQNDPYNQIAAKFLKRIKTFSKKSPKGETSAETSTYLPVDGDMFIEEAGKTKMVSLLKVAEPQKLSTLSAGVQVKFVIKNHSIAVTDQGDDYLGVLPDDISHHLIRLIHGGNKYQAVIKNIKTNSLSLIIREVYRCPRFRNQPSFLEGLNNMTVTYATEHYAVSPEDGEEDPLFGEMDEEEAA